MHVTHLYGQLEQPPGHRGRVGQLGAGDGLVQVGKEARDAVDRVEQLQKRLTASATGQCVTTEPAEEGQEPSGEHVGLSVVEEGVAKPPASMLLRERETWKPILKRCGHEESHALVR